MDGLREVLGKLMKILALSVCTLFTVAVISTACRPKSSVSNQPQTPTSQGGPVTDYISLVANLRAAGADVEPAGDVSQPFFSAPGRLIKVNGEDVQVYEYPNSRTADTQAAQVSPDGSKVGTSNVNWIGPPHYYKIGKLVVLYVGDNVGVTRLLKAGLGQQFAGQ